MENQLREPFMSKSYNLSDRASTREEEKSTICQVERLQGRVQFMGTINSQKVGYSDENCQTA